jgi:hypothetical protein
MALKILSTSTPSAEKGSDFELRLARKRIEELKTPNGSPLIPDDIVHDGSTGHFGLSSTELHGPNVFEYVISYSHRRLPWTMAK